MREGTLAESSTVVPAVERRVGSLSFDINPVEASLWLVVVSSVVLDVYTTYVGLSAGLPEGNPVVGWVIDTLGFGAFALGKLLVLGCAGLVRDLYPRYGPTIALGLAVPWTLTVLANASTLAAL
jgi:hypothetical protein